MTSLSHGETVNSPSDKQMVEAKFVHHYFWRKEFCLQKSGLVFFFFVKLNHDIAELNDGIGNVLISQTRFQKFFLRNHSIPIEIHSLSSRKDANSAKMSPLSHFTVVMERCEILFQNESKLNSTFTIGATGFGNPFWVRG